MKPSPDSADAKWEIIMDLVEGLYPDRVLKYMSPSLWKLWRERLGSYPELMVSNVIKDFRANSRYFPQVSQILGSCRERGKESAQTWAQRQADLEALRGVQKQEWDIINQVLEDYDLEKIKKALLAEEPRLGWMGKKPATSRWWKGTIYASIKRGRDSGSPAI